MGDPLDKAMYRGRPLAVCTSDDVDTTTLLDALSWSRLRIRESCRYGRCSIGGGGFTGLGWASTLLLVTAELERRGVIEPSATQGALDLGVS